MRRHSAWALLTLVGLLFASSSIPAVAAQEGVLYSQFHLVWHGDSYRLSFVGLLPAQRGSVEWTTWSGENGSSEIHMLANPLADPNKPYWARLPPDVASYRVDGRAFEVQAPPPADDDVVRIAFIADHGLAPASRAIVDAITASNASIVLIGGDLSYADGDTTIWDAWFEMIEPSASRIPWMPARGNHEARCLGGNNGVTNDCTTDETVYLTRFFLPGKELYYALDWGPVRVVVLDTEAYHPRNHLIRQPKNVDPVEQRGFLRDAVENAGDRWTVVMFHRPLYSSSTSHGPDYRAREDLLPVIDDVHADLVLTGHVHAYERSWPLRDGKVQATTDEVERGVGTIHVVGGGGGKSLYTGWETEPPWSAYRNATDQYLLLDVSPTRIEARAITPDGVVIDSFSIVRDDPRVSATSVQAEGSLLGVPGPGAMLVLLTGVALGRAWRKRAL